MLPTLACLALALPAQRPQPPTRWATFVRVFDAYAAGDSVVGASVLLVTNGRVAAHHEYGFADRALGQRVDTATIYHWASITKTLTAIAEQLPANAEELLAISGVGPAKLSEFGNELLTMCATRRSLIIAGKSNGAENEIGVLANRRLGCCAGRKSAGDDCVGGGECGGFDLRSRKQKQRTAR